LPKEWHATAAQLATGKRLAPDLAFVAGRYSFAGLVNWLKNPRALQPGTAMITPPMPEEQARAIATYLLTEPVVRPRPQLPARLPPLTRKVSFAEVDAKVFHRTCWHCHAEPDYSIGDGGPGNSGGFGFRPRGLNLASYEGIAAGVTDEHGQRVSVFLPAPGSDTPRLLESLLARHREEAVGGSGAVRGMPLGYAPLSPEEIQLVETWIVQGRPR
jgi:hypothetical protein